MPPSPEQGPDLMGTAGGWVPTPHPCIFVGEEGKRSRGAARGGGHSPGSGRGREKRSAMIDERS